MNLKLQRKIPSEHLENLDFTLKLLEAGVQAAFAFNLTRLINNDVV